MGISFSLRFKHLKCVNNVKKINSHVIGIGGKGVNFRV
jgi:hypothetical protein